MSYREYVAAPVSGARVGGSSRPPKGLQPIQENDQLTGVRTKEKNERLKSENERLKSESERLKAKMEKMETYAAASKARRTEIRMTIAKTQELDLCFLLDGTSSMQDSIDMVKDKLAAMADAINTAYPQCNLRVSFVLYRDYDDHDTYPDEGCNFTSDFRGSRSKFIKALSMVSAEGGTAGSATEDIFTGLERVADLDWRARNRLLVHICDSPCHGTRFHNYEDPNLDSYPNGDKLGRSITKLLCELHDHCQVTHYYFCHLNDGTKKMIQEFKKVVREDGWIMETQFQNIKNIPESVVSMSQSTITKSMSNISAEIGSQGRRFVPESVVQFRPRDWDGIDDVVGQQYKHTWYHSLDELLKRISKKEPLEVEKMNTLRMKILSRPFSAEGTLRWPYHAAIVQQGYPTRAMVVKRFKVPFGENVKQMHAKEQYLSQMEVQTVAAHMAHEFNKSIQLRGLTGVKKVEFTLVSTLYVGSKIYNMEKYLDGDWIRYSNNGGYVNTADYTATLQAFTHWTYERSNRMLMVTDLQGVKQPTSCQGKYMFLLCDPAIHCVDVMRFTKTNLGEEGMKFFFKSHICNDICRHLGIGARNGYLTVGTLAYDD